MKCCSGSWNVITILHDLFTSKNKNCTTWLWIFFS